MKSIPQLSKFMTTTPHSVGTDQKLSVALKLMQDNSIRHLPVLKAGKVYGILSDRDVKYISSFKDVNPDELTVEDACHEEPFTVSPTSPLDEVVEIMAEKRWGSVLVTDNNKLVGIFTAIDGLKALSELLHTRLK